ncbi:MAG: hypothetical protein ACI85F_000324 [Bacteroidia bacterium]|jgi:uncharacterized protein (DUF1015 family)
MTRIHPFKGVLPKPTNADRVVSQPYDQYSAARIDEILRENKESFLNVIRPEDEGEHFLPNSPALFAKSKQRFEDLVSENILLVDNDPSIYVYSQHIGNNSFTGLIACASVEDYDNGTIKIHEQTIAHREQILRDYLEVCDINAEPVCFTYPRQGSLELLTEIIRQDPPYLNFKTDDGKRHELWRISDEKWIAKFQEKFNLMEHIYIADGHHRSASSALLAHDHWAEGEKITGDEPYNYFLGIFFPDDQLKIYEFNRVVTDLGNLGVGEFLEYLEKDFKVEKKDDIGIKPEYQGHFGMYLMGTWYRLTYKGRRSSESVKALDVSILSDHILTPLLGIEDLRTDPRIVFVPGYAGLNALENKVDSGSYDIAFSLYPVSGEEFYAISDQGKTMPPKSTYIVPKLLSGLTVYSLSRG